MSIRVSPAIAVSASVLVVLTVAWARPAATTPAPAVLSERIIPAERATSADSAAAVTPATPNGHWVLTLEGNVNQLGITSLTAKPTPLGPTRKDATSNWAVVARAADGTELTRRALDLRPFDLDPSHVGRPTEVNGCQIVTSQIAALVSVHALAEATTLEIVDGQRVVSRSDVAALRAKARAGEGR